MSRAKLTKEEFYNEIKRIYDKYNKIDVNLFNQESIYDINFQGYCLKYGGIKNICKELGIEHTLYNEVSKEELIKRAEEVYEKYGRINKELCSKHQISSSSVRKQFGSYSILFKIIDDNYNFNRNVLKRDILDDIKFFCKKYDTTSSTLYRKHGKYSQTVIDRFGGWVNILEELELSPLCKKVGLEYMREQVVVLLNEYGFISAEIVNDNCDFTYSALRAHFKNKKDMSNFFGQENIFNSGRSNKERLIAQILNDLVGKNLYETEKSWEWFVNTNDRRMYVDFYVPSKNLAIEYDGMQHFTYVSKFHKTNECFEKQKQRDILKSKLLKENGVNLKRISYKEKITPELIMSLVS